MSKDAQDVDVIFQTALEKESPDQRAAYLDEACGGDAELRRRVERLLEAHGEVGGFLETPAAELGPTTFAAVATGAAAAAEGLPGNPEDGSTGEQSLSFLEPSEDPRHLGRLGVYEVLEVVGRGGMGIVVRAHDPRLNRTVAIKMLSPHLASNAVARKRFMREAQAAAAISHDHVVAIHAVDEVGGIPFMVMEYIVGVSLQDRIKRSGPLKVEEILRIGMQAAAGLAAAHAQGLVHRDIKPSNILLENGVERVKVSDFGLARAADDAQITQTGVVAGTPEYMSPEQAKGEPVDHRSDLFSLGCVLYAMCAGRSPFRASSIVDAIRRVCTDTPRPVREVNPEIPDWLAAIIDRLLAKEPDERFQSAGEVAELLGEYLAHVQQPSSVHLPRSARTSPVSQESVFFTPRRRHLLFAAIAACFILLSIGLSQFIGIWTTKPPGTPSMKRTERYTAQALGPSPNWALQFDGRDDYVAIPLHYDGSHPITLEAIVIPESENPHLVSGIPLTRDAMPTIIADTEGSGICLGMQRTKFFLSVHDGKNYRVASNTRFPFGRGPIHLAGVFDGASMSLFIDGQLCEQSEFPALFNPSKLSLMIGANPSPNVFTHDHFKGVIDEVRISAVARYRQDFSPVQRLDPDGGTLALYHFDAGGGDLAVDSSGNGHHGQIAGAHWVDANHEPFDLVHPIRSKERWDPLDDFSPVTDLLALVDPRRDRLDSSMWSFERKALTMNSGAWQFLQIPYRLPEEYHLVFTVERVSLENPFGVGMSLGGKQCFLRFDSRSGTDYESGLTSWNGELFETLGQPWRKQLLPCGEPITIYCTVRGSGRRRKMDVACDQKAVFHWEGDIDEISGQRPFGFYPKDDRVLSLCGFSGVFRITDVRLHAISDDARPAIPGHSQNPGKSHASSASSS